MSNENDKNPPPPGNKPDETVSGVTPTDETSEEKGAQKPLGTEVSPSDAMKKQGMDPE